MNRTSVAVALIAIGIAGLAFGEAERAWGAFLFNLMFWTGIAAGAPMLSAAIKISNGRWAADVHALARTWIPVLLLCVVLLAVLPLGARAIYPWATTPVEGLETWLSPIPLFGRDLIALALLAFVAIRYTRDESGNNRWAVVLSLAYVAVLTLLSVDLLMSLQPRWVSTLFGAHFFVGAGYGALASFPLMARMQGCELETDTVHDLGKLLFALSLLWTYMFWSQYLVTWYGNLPHEASFWAIRVAPGPWRLVGIFLLLACFAGPFVFLLSRRNRRNLHALAGLGIVIGVGLWAERLLLVMPSIRPDAALPLGWAELAVSGAFLGAVALVLGRAPTVSTPGTG